MKIKVALLIVVASLCSGAIAPSAKLYHTFKLSYPADEIQISTDGKLLMTKDNGSILHVFNLETKEEVYTRTNAGEVALSKDGKFVAIESDNTITIYDVASKAEVTTIQDYVGGWLSMAFSHDGKYLVGGSRDGEVVVLEVQSGEQTHLLKSSKGADFCRHTQFSPDGKYIATSGGGRKIELNGHEGDYVTVWEFPSGKEIQTLFYEGSAITLTFSSDGRALIITGEYSEYTEKKRGITKIWDVQTWKEKKEIITKERGWGVSASNNIVAVSREAYKAEEVCPVELFSLKTGKRLADFEIWNNGVNPNIAISGDGRYVAFGVEESLLRVYILE